jgi:choline dehydrogenase-like flavoprotein
MPKTTESTSFTCDVQGRFLCNDFSEVAAWRAGGGRPFDFIVIGGGTFGGVIAEHLWFRLRQAGSNERVLVLETGLFAIPEHVQNTGIQGLDVAPASTLDKLHQANPGVPDPLKPVNEVWGIPWRSTTAFPGLAFCIGGRSVYWGGWSPRLLPSEITKWPAALVADLNARYFDEAARQIGVTEANDFIFGELHTALRDLLAAGLSGVNEAIALAALPDFSGVTSATPIETVRQMLGLPSTDPRSAAALRNLLKLEAPLAVQARAPHAGFFPLNKFSTVPLLMKAARTAATEGSGDAHKSFMILPGCHAVRVRTRQSAAGTFHVTGVETNLGFIELAPNGVAVIALGTIESARIAAVSFENSGLPATSRIGRNLIAHLRSNAVIRVPRTALAGLTAVASELQTSALFVKGRHASADGTKQAHFHIQITATGGNLNVGAEDELFKKIPDVDFLDALSTASDTHVAIALRGIAEMQAGDPANPAAHPSAVTLDATTDEFSSKRAFVALQPTAFDNEVWAAMDQAMVDTAKLFGAVGTVQPIHDGMGTTHHETGTLAMGDPGMSVTNSEGSPPRHR